VVFHIMCTIHFITGSLDERKPFGLRVFGAFGRREMEGFFIIRIWDTESIVDSVKLLSLSWLNQCQV
jgi:hypothetical protein